MACVKLNIVDICPLKCQYIMYLGSWRMGNLVVTLIVVVSIFSKTSMCVILSKT